MNTKTDKVGYMPYHYSNLPNAMTIGRTYSEYLGEECEPEYERCYYCYGDGIVDAMQNDDGEVLSMTCPKCHGKGEIEI